MPRIQLTQGELSEIALFLDELTERFQSVEDPDFLREVDLLAHDLPRRIRRVMLDFRNTEPESGLCIVSGYPIDEDRIGATPPTWEERSDPSPTLREEIWFFLLGSLIGAPIGWSTQQDGYLVHDVLPIRGRENEQVGFSSEELLWWHIEDAFHPYRGDYVGLFCLRNPDAVPTTLCAVGDLELDPEDVRLLCREVFPITPDESHLPKNRGRARLIEDDLRESYASIESQFLEAVKIAVLFGDPSSPYLRLDPYFMKPADDPEAQAAFERLTRQIDQKLRDVPFAAGDACFVDNYRAVHGRRPFKARYDGCDRWLKRLNIVRDLRPSRALRSGPTSRIFN